MQLTLTALQKQLVARQFPSGWHITVNAKHTLIYSGAFVFITAVLSYLFGDGLIDGLPSVADRYSFTFIFLLMGVAHLFSFSKLLTHLCSADTLKGLIYSFVLAVLLTDCILLFFFITGVQNIGLAVAAGCAFMLPYIVNQCRLYYLRIENKEYENWVIPPGTEPDKRKSLLLNSTFFKIKIKVKYFDLTDAVFSVNLPRHLTLCAVFCRFLYDQHDIIEVADGQQQPYAWRFSMKGLLGNRVLDPDITLEKNGVKESDIILIERIKLS
jgi:Type VI secretion system, TssN